MITTQQLRAVVSLAKLIPLQARGRVRVNACIQFVNLAYGLPNGARKCQLTFQNYWGMDLYCSHTLVKLLDIGPHKETASAPHVDSHCV